VAGLTFIDDAFAGLTEAFRLSGLSTPFAYDIA
jgi:hypothetical protein